MTDPFTKSVTEMMEDPERRARLVAASERALEEKLIEQFKWSLPDAVTKVCTDFIDAEVAPAILAHLTANKGVIIKAATDASDEIGIKLAEAMVTKATSNLNGYRMSALMKELFS